MNWIVLKEILSKSKNNLIDCSMSSYLTFISGRTGNELDAALGKNNENKIIGVGKSIGAYYNFLYPEANVEELFPNLLQLNDFSELNTPSWLEINGNTDIYNLIQKSTYGKNIYNNFVLDESYIREQMGIYENLLVLNEKPTIIDQIRNTSLDFLSSIKTDFVELGDHVYTVPEGVTCITACVIGSGANASSTSGGAGGGYQQLYYQVSPGDTFNITISAGGGVTKFGDIAINAGTGAAGGASNSGGSTPSQTGKFIPVSRGGSTFNSTSSSTAGGGGGGYGGGNGGNSYHDYTAFGGGAGSNFLSPCSHTTPRGSNTGGDGPNAGLVGTNGGGGGGGCYVYYGSSKNTYYNGGGGGGGYGGGAGGQYTRGTYTYAQGGSGAVCIFACSPK